MFVFYGISFITKLLILTLYLLPEFKNDDLYEYILVQIIGIVYYCFTDCIKFLYHVRNSKDSDFIQKKWVLISIWVLFFINILIHTSVLLCSFYISFQTIKTKKNVVFNTVSSLTYFIPLCCGNLIKLCKTKKKI
jgi:hypothetical protein